MRRLLPLLLLALLVLPPAANARTLQLPYVAELTDSLDDDADEGIVRSEPFLSPIPPHQLYSFSFGLSLGLSGVQLDGDGYGGYHHLWPTGGFFVRCQLPKQWSVRLGFDYFSKGARGHAKRLDAERTVHSVTFHYLELPLVFEYLLSGRFQLAFGSGFGYLVSASQQHEGRDVDLSGVRKPDKVEWTAQASVGYLFTAHWAARFGASYSILPVRGKPSWVDSPVRTGQYNNTLHLRLEYLF